MKQRTSHEVLPTHRPRDLGSFRAGAILYGDLGTSKVYIIGLAFAAAGYSSFWLILAVSLLLILVGINYMVICRCYPEGGGVYSSVRRRSQVLSLVAALFLIADFIVTAALSAQSAFNYFQVETPVIWTSCAMVLIGAFNYFGPRTTGKHAFIIFTFAFSCLIFLSFFTFGHLGEAIRQLKPPTGGFMENWKNFVSVIVALSGVEVIANMTGVMKLDPGSTHKHPRVAKTSKKAILWVITEVALFTSFFSLASTALKGITVSEGQVYLGSTPIRDAWFRYLGETFIGDRLGEHAGVIFGWTISLAFAILLFSAVNTAINGLISILYVISKDGELPQIFQKLNRLGVPILPLIIATLAPIIILLFVHDIPGLANLYAIGFVGAITTNLIATASDRRLSIKRHERLLMYMTFAILFCIEITLFIDKPAARNFILTMVLFGLVLRGLTREAKERHHAPMPLPPSSGEKFAILCCIKKPGKALEYAIQRAEEKNCSLYILYVSEHHSLAKSDTMRKWRDDKRAKKLFDKVSASTSLEHLYFYYVVSDYLPHTIVHYAEAFEINEIVLEMSSSRTMVNLIKDNVFREVRKHIPDEMQLSIIPD